MNHNNAGPSNDLRGVPVPVSASGDNQIFEMESSYSPQYPFLAFYPSAYVQGEFGIQQNHGNQSFFPQSVVLPCHPGNGNPTPLQQLSDMQTLGSTNVMYGLQQAAQPVSYSHQLNMSRYMEAETATSSAPQPSIIIKGLDRRPTSLEGHHQMHALPPFQNIYENAQHLIHGVSTASPLPRMGPPVMTTLNSGIAHNNFQNIQQADAFSTVQQGLSTACHRPSVIMHPGNSSGGAHATGTFVPESLIVNKVSEPSRNLSTTVLKGTTTAKEKLSSSTSKSRRGVKSPPKKVRGQSGRSKKSKVELIDLTDDDEAEKQQDNCKDIAEAALTVNRGRSGASNDNSDNSVVACERRRKVNVDSSTTKPLLGAPISGVQDVHMPENMSDSSLMGPTTRVEISANESGVKFFDVNDHRDAPILGRILEGSSDLDHSKNPRTDEIDASSRAELFANASAFCQIPRTMAPSSSVKVIVHDLPELYHTHEMGVENVKDGLSMENNQGEVISLGTTAMMAAAKSLANSTPGRGQRRGRGRGRARGRPRGRGRGRCIVESEIINEASNLMPQPCAGFEVTSNKEEIPEPNSDAEVELDQESRGGVGSRGGHGRIRGRGRRARRGIRSGRGGRGRQGKGQVSQDVTFEEQHKTPQKKPRPSINHASPDITLAPFLLKHAYSKSRLDQTPPESDIQESDEDNEPAGMPADNDGPSEMASHVEVETPPQSKQITGLNEPSSDITVEPLLIKPARGMWKLADTNASLDKTNGNEKDEPQGHEMQTFDHDNEPMDMPEDNNWHPEMDAHVEIKTPPRKKRDTTLNETAPNTTERHLLLKPAMWKLADTNASLDKTNGNEKDEPQGHEMQTFDHDNEPMDMSEDNIWHPEMDAHVEVETPPQSKQITGLNEPSSDITVEPLLIKPARGMWKLADTNASLDKTNGNEKDEPQGHEMQTFDHDNEPMDMSEDNIWHPEMDAHVEVETPPQSKQITGLNEPSSDITVEPLLIKSAMWKLAGTNASLDKTNGNEEDEPPGPEIQAVDDDNEPMDMPEDNNWHPEMDAHVEIKTPPRKKRDFTLNETAPNTTERDLLLKPAMWKLAGTNASLDKTNGNEEDEPPGPEIQAVDDDNEPMDMPEDNNKHPEMDASVQIETPLQGKRIATLNETAPDTTAGHLLVKPAIRKSAGSNASLDKTNENEEDEPTGPEIQAVDDDNEPVEDNNWHPEMDAHVKIKTPPRKWRITTLNESSPDITDGHLLLKPALPKPTDTITIACLNKTNGNKKHDPPGPEIQALDDNNEPPDMTILDETQSREPCINEYSVVEIFSAASLDQEKQLDSVSANNAPAFTSEELSVVSPIEKVEKAVQSNDKVEPSKTAVSNLHEQNSKANSYKENSMSDSDDMLSAEDLNDHGEDRREDLCGNEYRLNDNAKTSVKSSPVTPSQSCSEEDIPYASRIKSRGKRETPTPGRRGKRRLREDSSDNDEETRRTTRSRAAIRSLQTSSCSLGEGTDAFLTRPTYNESTDDESDSDDDNKFMPLVPAPASEKLKRGYVVKSSQPDSDVSRTIEQSQSLDISTEASIQVLPTQASVESKSNSKNYRPTYTDEEKKRLYGEECFVIHEDDFDKKPENMFLWQIYRKGRFLLQYYPAKYAGRQFHISTPVQWFLLEEDFSDENFYKKFQPIPVIIVSKKVFQAPEYRQAQYNITVQFLYTERQAFYRSLKQLDKIRESEYLRPHFIDLHFILAARILYPDLPDRLRFANEGTKLLFRKQIESKTIIVGAIEQVVEEAVKNWRYSQNIIANIINHPKMKNSVTNVDKGQNCSACLSRLATVEITLSAPTEEEIPIFQDFTHAMIASTPMDKFVCCRPCSNAIKKFHRLKHFLYTLCRVVKQNMIKNIRTYENYTKQSITDAFAIWGEQIDKNWICSQFLELQVAIAEVKNEVEFTPRLVPRPKLMIECENTENEVRMDSDGDSVVTEVIGFTEAS